MATEEGVVYKTTQNTAWVRTQRQKTCDHCSSKDDCESMGSKMDDMEVELNNTIGATIGDRVIISMPTSALLTLSFLMYIVPIVFMIIGGIIGQTIAPIINFDITLSSVILSLIFFVTTIFLIRLFSNRLSKKGKYTPTITRIIGKQTDFQPSECSLKSTVID